MVMGMANLAMATGNIGRDGVGVNPLRGQNNVQGSCDMGSFPHELPRLPARVGRRGARRSTRTCGATTLSPEPGLRIPNMFDSALDGTFRALFIQGEDIAQSDPNTQHVNAALGAMDLRRRAGPVPERDGEVRARVAAGDVVPREGRHVHQRRAPDQPGPPGDAAEERQARVGGRLRDRHGDGLPHALRPPRRRSWTRSRDHADVRRGVVRPARRGRQHPVAVQRRAPARHADHARRRRSRAARAGSSRRRSWRPTSAAPAASR